MSNTAGVSNRGMVSNKPLAGSGARSAGCQASVGGVDGGRGHADGPADFAVGVALSPQVKDHFVAHERRHLDVGGPISHVGSLSAVIRRGSAKFPDRGVYPVNFPPAWGAGRSPRLPARGRGPRRCGHIVGTTLGTIASPGVAQRSPFSQLDGGLSL